MRKVLMPREDATADAVLAVCKPFPGNYFVNTLGTARAAEKSNDIEKLLSLCMQIGLMQ
jgi:hypothetical protein